MADPAIVKEICHSFKQMRLSKNLTQAELAQKAGLNRVTISRMEAGRAATLLTVVQVLRALDKLDILDIFREESKISPLQLLKLQEKQRQRASLTRKKTVDDREEKS
jgi:DNA-binding XRE family transcriptional regulator